MADRARMVRGQIESRGVRSPAVVEAMRTVPRHQFVLQRDRMSAYEDRPLPIGEDQTISQPYIVALMTELAAIEAHDRILEVGTGSGYQAAILAEIADQGRVYTIEIVPGLAARAESTLARLGYDNIEAHRGDGYAGWPEAAPFDAIVVTAAPARIPQPLLDQLAVGGRLVIPVGEDSQSLRVVTRTSSGFQEQIVAPVRFVPMTGRAQQEK